MTDAEFAREIAQPLTDQSGDYGAHSQSWRETETASATSARNRTDCHSAIPANADAHVGEVIDYVGSTVESVTSLSMVCSETSSIVAPTFDPS